MPRRPDPVRDLDWDPARAAELGATVTDLWTELLERLPELPVSRPFDVAEVRDAVALPVPAEGLDRQALTAHLRTLVFENAVYLGHPGFLAYICGAGTVPGAAADLLASGMNPNAGGFRLAPGAIEIELAVVGWLSSELGLPGTAGGYLVSGGAMANLVGLKAARDARGGAGIRASGVPGGLTIYASTEAHVVISRAADLLGLGSAAVRTVPVDDGYRMRVDALEQAVAADPHPIAVVGIAGTTSTGAIDPLEEIAAVCERHGLWMHVDACYGGPAVLADDLRALLAGIERADSVALDPHKWLYAPAGTGCVLVRDAQVLAASFAADADYIWLDEEARQGIDFALLGPQFSRGFTALRVWLPLLAHGRDAFARRISHDAALARYLGELVDERDDFELMTPVSLSICCFRYAPPELRGDEEALDRLNEQVMTAVMADGRVFCSNAILGGRFCLRVCIVNFRTEAEHLELLLDVAAEHGERLAASSAQAG